MTAAVLANGTQIGFGDADSPQVFNAINEVVSLSGVGSTKETVEVTNLDSTSKEYIAGLADGNSITIEMNWISDTQQDLLRTAVDTGVNRDFLVVFADSPQTKVAFTASFETFEISPESGAQITASVGLKVTGSLDWTTTAVIT